jgi:hypothetical protein
MKVDLVGKRFGKLTVLNFDHTDKNGQVWLCQCECGNKCFANTKTLNFKRKQSCGCLTSIAEYELEQYLIKNNYNYKHQYVFKDCKNIRPLPFDFAIFNDQSEIILLIELQGQQHYYPFTFNKEDKETKIMNLKERQRLDDVKRKYCEENRYELLEIKYKLQIQGSKPDDISGVVKPTVLTDYQVTEEDFLIINKEQCIPDIPGIPVF